MKPRYLLFWLLAVVAVPGRFFSIFYQAHGQTASQIGLLFSAQTLATLPSIPYFSHKADKHSREMVVLLLQAATTVVFLMQLPLLPSARLVSATAVFPLLMMAAIAYGICTSGLQPIVNGIAMEYLQRRYGTLGRLLFGRERLWGAIGWALASLSAGILCDIQGVGVLGIYLLHAGLAVVFSSVVFRAWCNHSSEYTVPVDDVPRFRVIDVDNERSVHDDLIPALLKVMNEGGVIDVLFFNVVFWLAVAIAAVENLLFVYLVSSIGASNTLCGLTIILTVTFEIPVYFLATNILRRVSTGMVFVIGACALFVRMVGYSRATNGWHILMVEPLHGVTFALSDAAAVAFVAGNAPGGAHAIAQSAIFVVRAVGMGIGSVVGGVVLQYFGAKVLYMSIAVIVLLMTITFAIAEKVVRSRTVAPIPTLCPLSTPIANINQDGERARLVDRIRGGTMLQPVL